MEAINILLIGKEVRITPFEQICEAMDLSASFFDGSFLLSEATSWEELKMRLDEVDFSIVDHDLVIRDPWRDRLKILFGTISPGTFFTFAPGQRKLFLQLGGEPIFNISAHLTGRYAQPDAYQAAAASWGARLRVVQSSQFGWYEHPGRKGRHFRLSLDINNAPIFHEFKNGRKRRDSIPLPRPPEEEGYQFIGKYAPWTATWDEKFYPFFYLKKKKR